ncbi:hypothetical protein LOK49_LG09G01785 [Camellia lanceoleosa]|uniref:Uncharacterized protein n=1 Tax=Camellia lanceoleosa TaxID=1840588 RepID=A0ACC0GF25_9ERIC|nr:hypothetical protein LOK49_LG09G01785 [Camellia lanceoleosa]
MLGYKIIKNLLFRSLHISEAIRMQIEVQTRLHEQLEDIQRIEAVSWPYDYVRTAVVEIREKLSIRLCSHSSSC